MSKKQEKSVKKTPAFFWVLSQAGRYRTQYLASVILAVLGVACAMAPYFIVARMVQELLNGSRNMQTFFGYCGLLVLFWIARVLLHAASTVTSHKATFQVLGELREKCCQKLARMPLGAVLDRPSGEWKNIIIERIDSIETTLAHILPEFTANLLVPVLVLIYMFVVDWRMALTSLITIPIGFLCFMAMMRDYQPNYERTVRATKALNDTAVEYIEGIEVIKVFGKTQSSYQRFEAAAREAAASFVDWMRSSSLPHALAFSIMPATLVSVLPIGGLLVRAGTLTTDHFILIIILSLGLMQPILTCMSYSDDIATLGSVVDQIRGVLDSPEMVRPDFLKGRGPSDFGITLDDVHFAYHDREVLHGVSLSIPADSFTAVVGPSGSGKSTIARLIDGLWDPDNGSIRIGGIDSKRIPAAAFNRYISYVSQENHLFNVSIRENIRMGAIDRTATDEEVERAAKLCGCHDFIMHLEKGYDTVVGDAGGHLSGGERQRICIARAMLKNAPIVILDEATAYTDPENEAVIQRSIARLVQGKTLIVIAHRLSTITDADQIIVIRDGKVEDLGTHEELLSHNGLYKRMWEAHIQVKDSDREEGSRHA